MVSVDSLKNMGADADEGVKRCFGNEEFYLKLVKNASREASFEKLYDALEAGDLDSGFEAAHALKGVLANLSLTFLLEPVKEVTELLRSKTVTDYKSYSDKIKELQKSLVELCNE